MPLSDEQKRKAWKAVRNYMQKRRMAQRKGVSKGALPKPVYYKEIIKAYENNPTGLNNRLKNLHSFSVKGDVYKTEGGVSLTKAVARYKNAELRRGEKYQKERYDKLKFNKSSTAKDYRKTKVDYLKGKTIENVKYSQLAGLNYSIENPEQIKVRKRTAVENFYKALGCGFADDNVVSQNPQVKARIDRYLGKFTEDEIADLMSSNESVQALMNYYRGENPNQPIDFAGESWEDLLWGFYEDLPNIAKGIYKKRKHNV